MLIWLFKEEIYVLARVIEQCMSIKTENTVSNMIMHFFANSNKLNNEVQL